MICPVCMTNAALLAAGASSTGALTALYARVFRRSKDRVRRIDRDQDSNRTCRGVPSRVAVRP
jgi:hypothetical protein